MLDLTVAGEDVSGVVLNLQRGATITGRIVFEGRSLPQPKDLAAVRITLAPAPGSPLGGVTQNVLASADGTFAFVGATPGRYRFSAEVPPAGNLGWSLKSAIVADRDVLDTPIEVRPGEDVSGRRGRTIRPGPDGKFKLIGLPAGEYYIGVMAEVDQPDLGDPAFLDPLAAGSLKLTLADGEKRVQDLKVARGR